MRHPRPSQACRIVDVPLPVPGQDHGARAWLVTEDDERWPRPAVLWLHWLGHRHNDRWRVPAARGRARRARCRLAATGGTLPVGPRPGRHRRRTSSACATRSTRTRPRSTTSLAQPGVDPARIALVGHDYGGMYGVLLADRDERISALASRHRTPPGRTGSRRTGSPRGRRPQGVRRAASPTSSPIDAVARLAGRLGDRMLLQWAGNDTFVTAESRAAYERANPLARSVSYDNADHMLDDRAALDLVAFLDRPAGARPKLKHVLVLRPCGSPTPRR